MPCLNLDLDFFDHPKTRRLIGRLGRGSEVLPIKLWCYCGKHHVETGRLSGYTDPEVESIVNWWGKPGAFVRAMLEVGFLKREGSDLIVHEWLEHEGHLWAFKVRAKKGAAKRWSKLAASSTNATSITEAGDEQCPIPTYLPISPQGPPKGGGRKGSRRRDRRTEVLTEAGVL